MQKLGQVKGEIGIDRRNFIRGAAAALVIPFTVSLSPREAAAVTAPGPVSLGAYISIAANNVVTVTIGSTEMGQGIMTGLAQLVAEELKLKWSQVRAEHAPASPLWPNPYGNPIFGAQLTGGSTSMMGWYKPLRTAAAITRDVLIEAAHQQFGGTWKLGKGGVLVSGTKTCRFSDVLATASTITPPSTAALATTRKFIGKKAARLDIPAKVKGTAVFGMDVKVPGMMFASVVHCPTLGGTVKTMPASRTGVKLVNLGNAVGVVASDTWTAMRAARSIGSSVEWTLPDDLSSRDSVALEANALALLKSTTVDPFVAEAVGSPNPSKAPIHIDATYSLPFLAHAAMEVMNCTASVTSTSCEIWAPTQGQQFIISVAKAITGLSAESIIVHTTFVGGGFGRKIESDYVEQAIKLSKAIGKPVKLIWSREEDFRNDKFRPCAKIRVQAGIGANRAFSGLIYRNVSPSISAQRAHSDITNPEDTGAVAGAVGLPYRIAARRIEYVALQPCDVPLGFWRSVGESYNTFAVESAIDELALAAGQDSLAFRKSLVSGAGGDSRAAGVLAAVEALSEWSKAPSSGRARGVAFLKGFGSYIAVVAEVSKTSASRIKVEKVSVAIDCGVVVNPDSVEAQVQGGVAHGLSAAMWNQQTFVQGKPQVSNYDDYPVLKLDQMPAVGVTIVASDAVPGGVGETGVPCVAPAVANAWAKLTKIRLRSLPFYPGMRMDDD
jgi:isoquinoline 1-oxidoreductase beta subunit